MAKAKKNTNTKSQAKPAVAPNDNMSWVSGFLMFVIGVFSLVSVLSHFIHWSSDLSALRNNPELTGMTVEFENICSSIGATVAYWMVDCSFGVFGVIIPIVITILGWRIFRKKSLHLNHFALSAALLLIIGSLTMGLIANKWGVRYDIGGELGQACAKDLSDLLGGFGALLVVVTGWILTGVFINHNFRRIVDSIGDGVEKQGGRVKKVVTDAIVNRKSESAEDDVDEVEDKIDEPQQPAVAEPAPVVPPVVPPVAPQPAVVAPAEPTAEEPQRMTMNEFLAQKREEQIGHPDYGRAKTFEDEFFVEGPVQEAERAAEKVEEFDMSEMEEEGFVVVPNGGAKPNDIDVNVLLAKEQQSQEIEQALDENGFVVLPSSNAQNVVAQPAETPTQTEISAPAADNVYEGGEGFYVEPAKPVAAVSEIDEQRFDDDHLVVKVVEKNPRLVAEEDIDTELYDPLRDLENYKKPYVSLLEDYKSPHKVSDAEIYDNKCRIQETLKYFGIPIVDIQATVGPTVTLYEIVQAQGVKISKVQGLEKDIAQSLRAQGIRIIAPIPGRGTIGIEVPNRDKQIVSMYSSICSEEFQSSKAELPIVIGRTIQNNNFTFDLAKLPHLLVAGATGQGKSVGLNAIITSLLYTKHPSQLKFVMIDPKMVEFSVYNKLERHFLAKMESEDEPIVTDPKKAVYVLNSLVEEMGRRLELCKMATARNIVEYNEKFTARRLNPNKGHRFLPYIVV